MVNTIRKLLSCVGVVAVGALIIAAVGCNPDASFLQRRDKAFAFNSQQLNATTNVVRRRWNQEILDALSSVSTATVNSPSIASASVIKRTNGSSTLFVFWIEETLTVDKLELITSDGRSTKLPIPKEQSDYNRRAAAQTIVFGAEIEMTTDVDDMSKTKVALVSGEQRISSAASLRIFENGLWREP